MFFHRQFIDNFIYRKLNFWIFRFLKLNPPFLSKKKNTQATKRTEIRRGFEEEIQDWQISFLKIRNLRSINFPKWEKPTSRNEGLEPRSLGAISLDEQPPNPKFSTPALYKQLICNSKVVQVLYACQRSCGHGIREAVSTLVIAFAVTIAQPEASRAPSTLQLANRKRLGVKRAEPNRFCRPVSTRSGNFYPTPSVFPPCFLIFSLFFPLQTNATYFFFFSFFFSLGNFDTPLVFS